MAQSNPVAHGRELSPVVAQMAAGSGAQRLLAVVQQVFRAEVRDDARGRQPFVGEQRETFLKPVVPAQRPKLGCEVKGQLEVLRKKNDRTEIGPPGRRS